MAIVDNMAVFLPVVSLGVTGIFFYHLDFFRVGVGVIPCSLRVRDFLRF